MIDQSHPLSKGLRLYLAPSNAYATPDGGARVDGISNQGNVVGSVTQVSSSTTIDTRVLPGFPGACFYSPLETLDTYLALNTRGQLYDGWPISYSVMVYVMTPSSLKFVFELDTGAGQPALYLFWYVNTIYTGYRQSNGFNQDIIGGTFPSDRWVRITAVFEKWSVRVYTDGRLVNWDRSYDHILAPANGPLYLYRRILGTYTGIKGGIADFALWNRALSEEEVMSHANDPYQFLASPGRTSRAIVESGATGGPLVCSPRLLERLTINRLAGF